MELNPGKIQVAASDLVLYQKGKEPIRWPLRCLRRYGFDEELFSFESGRRCPTGSGIYAFKCRCAEELFNMVQESIQRAGQEDLRANSSGSGGGGSQGIFPHSSRPNSRPTSFVEPTATWASSSPRQIHMVNNNSPAQQHLYINGVINNANNNGSGRALYINTERGGRSRGGAFQLDESAPLIAFLNQPGQRLGGPGGGARGQVNYAVLDLPSSMENLLDEEGQGAVHNFPPRFHADHGANRHSMPADLSAALGPDDGLLLAGDSDVFLADPDGAGTCPTYINVNIDEPSPPQARYSEASGGSATGLTPSSGGGANAGGGGLVGVFDHTGSMPNYANVGSSSVINNSSSVSRFFPLPARQQKPSGINYIQLELNSVPSSDPGSGPNLSPTSPTSMVSNPESPGYAKIDFNKTEALSHFTRGGTDGDEPGARKTRHNSTIGM